MAKAMPRLELRRDGQLIQALELERQADQILTLGSARECAWHLEAPGIQAVHAEIWIRSGRVYLRDRSGGSITIGANRLARAEMREITPRGGPPVVATIGAFSLVSLSRQQQEERPPEVKPADEVPSGILTGASLEVHEAGQLRGTVPITLDVPFSIGSHEDRSLVLEDPSVSPCHADLLVSAPGTIRLQDLRSRTGIWQEEQQLEACVLQTLRPGESFRIGPFYLVVRLLYETLAAPPPPTRQAAAAPELGQEAFLFEVGGEGWYGGQAAGPAIRVTNSERGTESTFTIQGGHAAVGRHPDSDVVLEHERVSARHLRLEWDGSRLYVVDLGSTNGTLLGGRRLTASQPAEWRAGVALTVAVFRLYQIEGERSG